MSSRCLDIALFVIVVVIILLVLVMLAANIFTQYVNYRAAIKSAFDGDELFDHAAVIAYSRAWDFAIIKTSSLFLSILVILIGSLYVLRVAHIDFNVSADTDFIRGALSTSSPGLAMVLLGVVLTVFSLNHRTEIGYEYGRAPSAIHKEGAVVVSNSFEKKTPGTAE